MEGDPFDHGSAPPTHRAQPVIREWASGTAEARASRVVATLIGIASFLYLMAFPPTLNLSDESLFLYGAKRVLHGQAMYHDIFEFITPAGFYLFALVFAAAGTSILAARVAMATVLALSCVLLFVLARRVAGTVEAALAALVFAGVSYPVWNMASPHWLSTLLCLATAAALLREPSRGAGGVAAGSAGALAGLTFCNQQQRGVGLALWLGVAVVALAWQGAQRDRLRCCGRALARAAAGWAVVVLVILGYSVWRASLAELVYAIFTFVLSQYRRTFTGKIAWGSSGLLTQYNAPYTWPWLARAVPGVLAAEALALVWRVWHQRGRAEVVRGCLLLLACLMAASVLYFPDIIHVAFVAPFSLIVAARLLHGLRSSRFARRGRVLPAVQAILVTLAFLAVLHKGWASLTLARRASPERRTSAFGTLAGADVSLKVIDGIRDAMRSVPEERRTFFSYPGDASLYLTVPGANPTPFSLLMRGYNTPEQFQTALEAIERARTDYIVVNPIFAVGEGDPIVQFLEGRYALQTRVEGAYFVFARIPKD